MATTNPQKSLKSAVELLTSTMQDPLKANVCAIRLSIAADHIDQALEACTSIAEKTKIVKSYPELLRAGIKFLTFKRSPPDHVAMLDHLRKCRCDFGQTGMRNLHKPSRSRIEAQVQGNYLQGNYYTLRLVFDAVTTISNCLILTLADLTQHKFRSGNANTREQPWPQGPEDLLPPGPKDSVAGLELWASAPPLGYIVFKLAGHLARFYVPFAQEVFQSPHFTIALAKPVQHLEEAVKFYDEGNSSPLARTHFFTHPVVAIFDFMENLLYCDTPEFIGMIIARGSWISPILARLTTILSTLPREPEWSKTRIVVQHLTACANAEVDPVTGAATVRFERKLMTELPYFDRLEKAFNAMVDTRKMGCWNITCSSALASDTIHSRLCSKCNLIRFCGERCQKEAWKCATLPHKSVCTKIHSLREALGADDWLLMWTPNYTYPQFQVTCEVKGVDTDMVRRIGSTLSALHFQKRAFLSDSRRAGASQVDRLIMAEQEKSAIQKSKDLKDRLGDRLTIMDRGHGFAPLFRDAYR